MRFKTEENLIFFSNENVSIIFSLYDMFNHSVQSYTFATQNTLYNPMKRRHLKF